ncbi:MAG: type I DNA topoisomerase [Planctomycetota bacterium]|nr:type I DNA topoisomerase [Planctomycetota bacterium]
MIPATTSFFGESSIRTALVIVESPAKAKTIKKYLGRGYTIKASMGHVRDLPSSGLGVDVEHGFQPDYEILPRKKKVVRELKLASQKSDDVYLATDPDREGEAIAWHLRELLAANKADTDRFHRVAFNEITMRAVRSAFEHPGTIDARLVDSQQARRILDRLVGYEVSPLLWRRMRGARSAGRVQSVAVRLVVDREREIRAFVPQQYWTVEAVLKKRVEPANPFRARLVRMDGKKIVDIDAGVFLLPDEASMKQAETELRAAAWTVVNVDVQTKRRNPSPPFITSTLQRAAFTRLRMSPQHTMQIAQELYEGVELGTEGPVGLITYMRTDSLNVASQAQDETLAYVRAAMGPEYAPEKPNFYRSRETSQGAHEAIRPTTVTMTPESVAAHLTRQQAALYELIWKRFLASQMAPAQIKVTAAEVMAKADPRALSKESGQTAPREFTFRASASEVVFPGFLRVYGVEEGDEDRLASSSEGQSQAPGAVVGQAGTPPRSPADDRSEELPGTEEIALPPLEKGEPLDLHELHPNRKETEPPPRYNEASLIKALEDLGIGRPSTYAPTMMTILKRKYVQKDRNALRPTELGERTTDLLVKWLPHLMDVGFTSQMEEKLDEVEAGKERWTDLVRAFYADLKPTLETALKVNFQETTYRCPSCKQGTLRISEGRNGEFVSCSRYPKCKFSSDFKRKGTKTDGRPAEVELIAPQPTGVSCTRCAAPMFVRSSKRGEFLACSAYPKCKTTLSFKRSPEGAIVPELPEQTNLACAKCGKPMVVRSGRNGQFLACSGYPDCRNTKSFTRDEKGVIVPIERPEKPPQDKSVPPCDLCGSPMVLRWKGRRRFLGCSAFPTCKNVKPITRSEEPQKTGEKCEKCGRDMVVKMGRHGKFAACSGYPACRNAKPLGQ